MAKPSTLIVSFHFYPSPEVGAKRPSETALCLLRRGHAVTVLRAWDKSFSGRAVPAALAAANVVSVRIPRRLVTAAWIKLKSLLRRKRSGSPGEGGESTGGPAASGRPKRSLLAWLRRQLLAYDTLFQGQKRWLLRSVIKLIFKTRGQRFDLVIASGPPMVSYICGWTMARLKGAKLILDYRDPWYLHGDKELTTVMLGHPLANFENALAQTCARRCAVLVAASPGTKRHILESFDVPESRVQVVRNGFDDAAIIEEMPPTGSLELLYSGSLYWNRNPFPFLEALEVLVEASEIDRSLVHCRLAGNCDEWKGRSLHAWVEQHGMRDVVEILPFLDAVRLGDLVRKSNVLINFAQGQQRQIPAKSYEYIASRRDVLVITENDSDVADLFREADVGLIVEPEDDAGFASALRALYERHVLAANDGCQTGIDIQPYSRAAQLERFTQIVDAVLSEPPAQASREN